MVENLMSEHKQAITKLEDEVVVLKNELHGLKQRMAKEGIEEKKKESEPERELSPCKEYKKTEDVREHQDDISRIFQEFATLAVRNLGDVLSRLGVNMSVKEVWILKQDVRVEELSYEEFRQLLEEHGVRTAAKGGGDEDEQRDENEEGEEVDKTKKKLRWADDDDVVGESEVEGKNRIKAEEMPARLRRSGRKMSQEEEELFVELVVEQGNAEVSVKEFEDYVENCFDEDMVAIKQEIKDRKEGAAGVEKNNDPSDEWTQKFIEKHAEWWRGGRRSVEELKKKVREELNAAKDDKQRENNE